MAGVLGVGGFVVVLLVTLLSLAYASENIDAGQRLVDDTLGPADISSDLKRNSRSLLAVGSTAAPPADGYYLNASNCVFLFNNGAQGVITTSIYDKSTSTFIQTDIFNFTLPIAPDQYTATCTDGAEPERNISLKLTYNNIDVKGRSNVELNIKMLWTANSYWIGSGSTLDVEGKYKFKLIDSIITASDGFSFSCSNLVLNSNPVSNTTLDTIQLSIKRFQIQPFSTNKTTKIFEDSFDCATWFTIPLWVGLIFIIIFTALLGLGILMLFSIKTMDRFENPKGKTITVAASD